SPRLLERPQGNTAVSSSPLFQAQGMGVLLQAMQIVNEKVNPSQSQSGGRATSPTVQANTNLNSAVNLDDGSFFGSFFTAKKKKGGAVMEPVLPWLHVVSWWRLLDLAMLV